MARVAGTVGGGAPGGYRRHRPPASGWQQQRVETAAGAGAGADGGGDVGKKKATGMSKRLGFTDRATIAENKDILRYNERLDREARGLPPEAPRGPRDGARGPRGGRPARADRDGGARPPRAARPPRPPALDDEQVAALQAALAGAVGETGLEQAGTTVIERLAAHHSFDRATAAGWDVAAAGGNAAERTEAEWALLRKAWLGIRLALLEAYAQIKPELAASVERERKQLARLDRPRRDSRTRGAGERRKPRRGERPGPRRPGAGGPPSPADVARVAHHPVADQPAEPGSVPPGEVPAGSVPPGEVPAGEVPAGAVPAGAGAAADEAPELAPIEGGLVGLPPADDLPVEEDPAVRPDLAPADLAPADEEPADEEPADLGSAELEAGEGETPQGQPVEGQPVEGEPAAGEAVAAELRAEHGGHPAPTEPVDTDQMTLGF